MHACSFRGPAVKCCAGVIIMSVTQIVSHQKSILQSRENRFTLSILSYDFRDVEVASLFG